MIRVDKPKQAVWILARISKLVDAIIYFTLWSIQPTTQIRPESAFSIQRRRNIPNIHCCSMVTRKLPVISQFTSCFHSSLLRFYRTLSSISILWIAFFWCMLICLFRTYHYGVHSLSFLLLHVFWLIHVEYPSYLQKRLTSGDRQNLSQHSLLPYYFDLII